MKGMRHIGPIVLLAGILLAVYVPLVMKTQLWLDEVYDNEPGYNLAYHGKIVWDLGTDHAWKGAGEHFFVRPPFYSFVVSRVYLLAGFSRAGTLAMSLIPGVLGAIAVYGLGYFFMARRRIAVVAGLAWGLSHWGVWFAKCGRADALAFLLFACSLLFFFKSRQKEGGLSKAKGRGILAFSGVLAGLAVLTYHLYLFGAIGFFWYQMATRKRQAAGWWQDLAVFWAFFLVPVAVWVRDIVMYYPVFRTQIAFHTSAVFKGDFRDLVSGAFGFDLFSLTAAIAAAVAGWKRFKPEFRQALVGFVFLPMLALFPMNMLRLYYLQVLYPFICVLLAWFLVDLWNTRKPLVRVVCVGAIAYWVAIGVVSRYWSALKDWNVRDLPRYEQALKKALPKGHFKVAGSCQDWYVEKEAGWDFTVLDMAIYDPSIDWKKFDYLIIPGNLILPEKLVTYLRDSCRKVQVINPGEGRILKEIAMVSSGYTATIYEPLNKPAQR